MKFHVAVAATLALAGCNSTPVNCGTVKQQLDGCLAKHRRAGSREVALNCFPYSASERISGTWAHSFEFNQFYEDRDHIAVDRAFTVQDNPVQLDAVSDALYDTLDPKKGGLSQIAQIVFEGRRPLCDFGLDRWIVVDRVVSQKIVFSRPYGQR